MAANGGSHRVVADGLGKHSQNRECFFLSRSREVNHVSATRIVLCTREVVLLLWARLGCVLV